MQRNISRTQRVAIVLSADMAGRLHALSHALGMAPGTLGAQAIGEFVCRQQHLAKQAPAERDAVP